MPISFTSKNKYKVRRRRKSSIFYGQKKYDNTLFPHKSKPKFKNLVNSLTFRIKLIFSVSVIVVLAATWVLFYSSLFRIKTVEARGEGRIDPAEIEKLAWQEINDSFFVLWPKGNIFAFGEHDLQVELERKYSFDSLVISKKLPGVLSIEYKEKEYAFIWHEADEYSYIDETGAVIASVNLLEVGEKDYPIIDNLGRPNIADRQASVSPEQLSYIRALFARLKTQEETDPVYKVARFIVDNETATIKADLENGPELYFNTEAEIEKQMEKLSTIRNVKLKNDFTSKVYIDLRFGDRVYYR